MIQNSRSDIADAVMMKNVLDPVHSNSFSNAISSFN